MSLRILFAWCLAGLALAGLALPAHARPVTVSAAASLGPALREMSPLFEQQHPGAALRLNLGASGALLAQATQGAPVDVLLTADPQTMDLAQARGLVQASQRRTLCTNTLVVIVPASARNLPANLADLARPGYTRVAIGLPASVPAGRYARGALESAGLWPTLEPKMVGAHHVRQALDYVARAEVEAGFVYATDAATMPDRVRVAFVVPTKEPILYAVAPIVGAPNPTGAARFIEFLFTPAAQAVLARHGFGRP